LKILVYDELASGFEGYKHKSGQVTEKQIPQKKQFKDGLQITNLKRGFKGHLGTIKVNNSNRKNVTLSIYPQERLNRRKLTFD